MNFRPQKTPFRRSLGERGEVLAWEYLLKKGYKILEKNYRCKIGEIDIIACHQKRLLFIEVKTRSSEHYGPPEEAVTLFKQKKIIKIAEWFRKEKGCQQMPAAFEVIAIDWDGVREPRLRHIPNAFEVPGDSGESTF